MRFCSVRCFSCPMETLELCGCTDAAMEEFDEEVGKQITKNRELSQFFVALYLLVFFVEVPQRSRIFFQLVFGSKEVVGVNVEGIRD